MNVNAGKYPGILPELQFRNQMETFGSSNGDQMGPSAAESFLENFVRGGPGGGLGIWNPSLIMKLLP